MSHVHIWRYVESYSNDDYNYGHSEVGIKVFRCECGEEKELVI